MIENQLYFELAQRLSSFGMILSKAGEIYMTGHALT